MSVLKLIDPSGEVRKVELAQENLVGRQPDSKVFLRDPLAAPLAAKISKVGERFWLRVEDGQRPVELAGLTVRELEIPQRTPFNLGDTCFELNESEDELLLPEQPRGITHWKTCCDLGSKALWMAKRAAETNLPVYLSGETGTGKEVLARLVHEWSKKKGSAFVPLNCAAFNSSLAESELFGHVKGAFTGAHRARPGALVQAHGGTLFLDEIGDLPADIQVKLLRFLEDGEVRPVGSDETYHSKVRLVCATNVNLEKHVRDGKFRRDLYFRLASVQIKIPSLRSRPEDTELLANFFSSIHGKVISLRAMLRLQAYTWPGNVRELRHAVERASGLSGSFSNILDEDCFVFLKEGSLFDSETTQEIPMGAKGPLLSLKEMEKQMLIQSLKLAKGNREGAAKILGVARSTVFEMLKRYNIPGPRTKTLAS